MIDVCLLLEGTYPYVAGGVSTWVHQLISAMKDIHFGIIYIAPYSDFTRTLKYRVPDHVVYLKEVYLHDYDLKASKRRRPKKHDYEIINLFYQDLIRGEISHFPEFVRLFHKEEGCFDLKDVFYSRQIWSILLSYYEQLALDVSFIDFFWTWRSTHLPLLQIAMTDIPPAKIYHSISTGYAGVLGAIAKTMSSQSKYFLTEHGIYSHERVLEISQANWIYESQNKNFRAQSELSFFKKWWIMLFKTLGKIAYDYSDQIFTLYEGNKVRQVLEGADANKVSIVPNGIDLKSYQNIKKETRSDPQIGFIGRVVSIKDVKTFIRAAKYTLGKIPNAQFYIIGPTDEEEDYYDECRALIENLGLEDKVLFTGRVNIKDYYHFLDLVVLTSVSEAQPYVILEANIVGIPVIATDVGDCRDMLEGKDSEDRFIGPSGLITEVSNPDGTGKAIVKLLTDKIFYEQCSHAGKERVKKYYDQDDLLSRYLNIYEQSL